MVRVQLLVSDWCPTCPQAERIWREVAEEKDIRFEVLDVAQVEGRELVGELRIRTIPSVVIDGRLKGVGVQTRQQALALVADAPARVRGAFRFVGMTMGPTSRASIAAAMLFLVLSGAFLPFRGLTGGAARPVSLHLFLLGFVTFMIYGVGEHMLPRFAGRRILMGPLAWAQQVLAHAGLIGLLTGLWAGIPVLAVSGGALVWLGLLVFAIRLMPVVWGEEEIPAGDEPAAD